MNTVSNRNTCLYDTIRGVGQQMWVRRSLGAERLAHS